MNMKKINQLFKPVVLILVTLAISISVIFSLPCKETALAQENDSCGIAEIKVDTDVLCWAIDAADFVIQNKLFSLMDANDLRDAVKYYRFYQLVMKDLNK
jgi:hypothetical protein